MRISIETAQQLDREDPLASFRERFIIPVQEGKEQVYFLGNSLGLQPKTTAGYIDKIMKDWANLGVESFFMPLSHGCSIMIISWIHSQRLLVQKNLKSW